MKNSLFLALFCLAGSFVYAQTLSPQPNPANCGATVPYFYIDMTGAPDSLWISPPGVSRSGNCCGMSNPQQFVYFAVVMDPNAAMIEVDIFTGAEPRGSGRYRVNCGVPDTAGQPICITTPGLNHIVYYKPGGNPNQYYVRSIPKPTFPKDDTIRLGCALPIKFLGFKRNSLTWNAINPANPTYNSYLSYSSNPADSSYLIYSPGPGAPPFIDYRVCGMPIATACGYVYSCDTIRLYNADSLRASVTPNPAYFCFGSGGVTMLSDVDGGDPNSYQYTWLYNVPSPAQVISNTSTAQATAGGSHTLIVRDRFYDPGINPLTGQQRCPAVSVPITVNTTSPPTINAGPDQTLCPESPSAFLNATFTNATGVVWSGGAGTFNPNDTVLGGIPVLYTPTPGEVSSGSVTLTATAYGYGSGCAVATDQITLFFPPPIVVTLNDTLVNCFGDAATLTPQITNGIGSFSYAWNTGATTAQIIANAGNYCVNVTDSLGCAGSACANIVAPPQLTLTMSSTGVFPTDLDVNGTATANPGGGTPFPGPSYTYLWSDGQTTQTATGLAYGVYTVTVTDANGCTVSSSVVVNKPSCVNFEAILATTNVSCFGYSNGTATVTAINLGSGDYSFSWSSPIVSTDSVVTGLSAGSYLLYVTDNDYNCLDIVAFSILEPAQLTNTMNSTNAIIIGGNEGTATANPSGGTGPYSYLWSPGGQTTQGITGLTAGTYIVTITDFNGCSIIDSVKINQPPCNNLTLTGFTTPVSCFGGSNGSATAFVFFGREPVTYLWSPGGQTTQSITNLSAGVYTVSITDSLNCTSFLSLTVTQPSQLSIAAAPTNPQCSYTTDGTIELVVSGGTYPYSYNWSNGAMVEDLYDLSGGTFTVTVTDSKTCSATTQATLVLPSALGDTAIVTNITCFGGNDGAIDFTPEGGVLPYSYSWSTGDVTQDISGLSAGAYTITLTDGNGCVNQNTLSFFINQPQDLIADSIWIDCPLPGSDSSLVTVFPSGGAGGSYFVSFDNGITFQSQGDYDAYLPGGFSYYIVVRDSNNCVSTSYDSIYVYPKVTIKDVLFDACFDNGQATTLAEAVVVGGVGGAYQVSFDNGLTFGNFGDYTANLSPNQTYYIIARDSTGCQSDTIVIYVPDSLTLSYTTSLYNGFNISCFGYNNGEIDVTVIGGTAPYSFAWSNGYTTQDADSLTAGTYQLVVTDFRGCNDSIQVTLTEPPVLVIDSIIPSVYAGGYNISCNGLSNGSANLFVQGGTPGYTYNWNGGAYSTEDLSSVGAGTYTVTVSDQNGCTVTGSIILTQPPVLVIDSIVPSLYAGGYNISCNGLTNGSANLYVQGGTPGYAYNWNNGAFLIEDLSNVGAGTYNVTVTDQNGCTVTSSITLTQPPVLVIDSIIPGVYAGGYNISCNGLADGSVNLYVQGGTVNYTYNWNNGAYTTEDLSNVGAGTYSVTVTDQNNCTVTGSITLTQPPILVIDSIVPSLYAGGFNISCGGLTNGSANLYVQGGTPGYTYNWNNGAYSTEDLSNIGAGVYNVTVSDQNGCDVSGSITLTQPPVLVIDSIVASVYAGGYNISCNGLTNGSANLFVQGGTPGYSFNWNSGAFSTEDLSNVGAGTYTVTVTDQNSCTTSASIMLMQPPVLVIDSIVPSVYAGGYNISCNGLSNGSANLFVQGGSPGYTYNWNGGAFSTEDLSNVGAGTYNVTVTDQNSCTTTASITLTQPLVLVIDSIVPSVYAGGYNISCNGLTNGSANLFVQGGTPGYSYNWNGGAFTTEDLSNVGAGTYTVTVTDQNNCTVTNSITLTQPPVLVIDSIISSVYAGGYNISCNGLTNGNANLFVQGGTPGYSYNWNGGAFITEDLSNVGAGTYSVTVTDQNSCTVTGSITLNEPPVLVINNMIPGTFNGFNVSCFGGSNGTIDLVVAGGTPSYTYDWGAFGTTEDLSGLAAGTYTVTVTDQNNCTVSNSITLTQPPLLDITSAALSSYAGGFNVSCNGSTDGIVNISFTGGVAPFSFNWSNSTSNEDLSGVGAGTYTLTITDLNFCTVDTTVTLTQPPSLVVDSIVSPMYAGGSNISCFGLSDGDINLYVNGGVASYNFNWNGGIYTTQNLQDVAAGVYQVTVSDQNGCTVSTSITLTQPDELVIDSIVPFVYAGGYNISCFGLSNGSVDLYVDGGTPAYSFNWNNGAYSTQDINAVGAGSYQVTVSDQNGCTVSGSLLLTQPDELLIDSIIPSVYAGGYNISCHGLQDGSIDLYVDGGTPAYTYNWNNGSYTTSSLTNLIAGAYSVTVTDLNNCSVSGIITLTEPPVLVIDSIVPSEYAGGYNISCFGLTNGDIDLIVSGGTPGYYYVWNNGAYSSEDLNNVPAGFYTVTVTDQNGCTRAGGITLTQPDELLITSLTATVYAGNYNISCYGLSDGNIDLEVSGGTPTYNYNWNAGASNNQDLLNVPAGVYQVTVTDLNNCTVIGSITLVQPQELLIDSLIPSLYAGGYNISCNGLINGSISLYFSGGTSSFNFNWNNGAFNSQNLTLIGAGTYTVVVTDANSCSVSETIELTQPDPIMHTLIANQFNGGWNISCNGLSDGSIDLEVSGGTPEYSYNWNNSSTTQDLSSLAAGTYIVVVSDQNGCSFTDQIILTQPDAYMLSATVNDVLCNGFGNGSIDLTVTGGQPQYSYSWSNNATTQDLSNLGPGTYTVTIVDQNSCDTTYVFSVIELSPITAAAVETDVDCYGNNNGAINLIVGGGFQPYTFVWSNGADTEDLNNLSAGIYVYTITDINGCTLTDTANVYEPEFLTVTLNSQVLFNGHNISFYNGNDGSITTIVNGGTPEFTYLWSTADTTKNLNNLTAGTYSVIVTDANGCTATASITLTQPLELAMPNAYSPNGDGFNDFFVIHGIEAYPNNVFTVVNRWGNVVYEKKNYHNEWNGNNNNGGQLPDGTYFVILDINEGEIILKGYVDMRRSK